VESPEEYGGFLIKRLAKEEPFPYEIDEEHFERFPEYKNMFGREQWDEEYQQEAFASGSQLENSLKKRAAGVPGWNVFEHEFREASWWLARNRGANSYGWVTEPNEVEPQISEFTTEEVTRYIKQATLFFGASTVGIIETDEKWFYASLGRTPEAAKPLVFKDVDLPINDDESPEVVIPKKLNRTIVFTLEMDYDSFRAGGVNKINGAGAGQGYSKMAFTAGTLAQYIRNLGYQAIPCGNDTGLSIPMAIQAGLGEQGRLGLLITPKYGPRVRLAKVLTDMPLDVDSPITFGVKEFCEVCGLCADYCPSGSIPTPEELPTHTFEAPEVNNIKYVKKWQVVQRTCKTFWNTSGVGCGNCLGICPFNKPTGWLHEATRILIGAKSGTIDSLLANLDEASGYGGTDGQNPDPDLIDYFWKEKKEFMHIKA
jgi:reductive dehalogenase